MKSTVQPLLPPWRSFGRAERTADLGRDAIYISSSSSPRSGRCIFTSRRQPFVAECCDPLRLLSFEESCRSMFKVRGVARLYAPGNMYRRVRAILHAQ